MRNIMGMGAVTAISVAISAGGATAGTVASYQADFAYPSPSTGWSYLWNANGPLGTATNYVPLVADSASPSRYETQDQDAFPDAAPGGSLSANPTTLIPGHATGQGANTIERFVIAAYTFSAEDIATNGNFLTLASYSFTVGAGSEDGITAAMYLNDFPILAGMPLGPTVTWDDSTQGPNSGPIGLGPIVAGMTFYVAIGSNGAAILPPVGSGGNDVGDIITLDYTLTLTPIPEPAAAGLAGVASAFALLARRRRVT
jgi:hypothetical protein